MTATQSKIRQCRALAFIGIGIMGAGSFLACLPRSETLLVLGSAIMLIGIAITAYGFAYWRP